jgi:hypothetical protein
MQAQQETQPAPHTPSPTLGELQARLADLWARAQRQLCDTGLRVSERLHGFFETLGQKPLAAANDGDAGAPDAATPRAEDDPLEEPAPEVDKA